MITIPLAEGGFTVLYEYGNNSYQYILRTKAGKKIRLSWYQIMRSIGGWNNREIKRIKKEFKKRSLNA